MDVWSGIKNLVAFIADRSGESGRYYSWGVNDDFPIQYLTAIYDSGTAHLCVEKVTQFICGHGFKNKDFGDKFANPKQRYDEFLRSAGTQLSIYKGVAILHRLDHMGVSKEKYVLPINDIRRRHDGQFIYEEGYKDYTGRNSRVNKRYILPEWHKNLSLETVHKAIAKQKESYGVQKGFIQYVFQPGAGIFYDKYPMPPAASGFNDLRADALHAVTEENLASNTFTAEVAITTRPLDKTQRQVDEHGNLGKTEYERFVENLKAYSGANGDSILHLESSTGDGLTVTPLNSASNTKEDKLNRSRERVRPIIAAYFNVPPVLIGIATAGKLGDTQEMVNHFKLFNLALTERRELLYTAMREWSLGDESIYEIEPLNLFAELPEWLLNQLPLEELRLIFDLPAPVIEGQQVGAPAAAPQMGAASTWTGKQFQGVQRVVRKFNRDEITYEQAKQTLQGFGLTPEEADVWLLTKEEEEDGTITP